MSSTLTLSRSVASQIRSKILMSGPVTVAEYMKLALTQTAATPNVGQPAETETARQEQQGYYMKQDVFGQKGDFITSPEISQMFGELIGVWGIQCWQQLRGPKKFNVVELGPGRGTLSSDMLRVFRKFESVIGNDVCLNLVEISSHLSKLQMQMLCGMGENKEKIEEIAGSPPSAFQTGVAKTSGCPVSWYRDIRDVPTGNFTFYVAHEFFDALPVHKFQKRENEWREVLVDVGPEKDSFAFVISRNETPVLKVLKARFPAVFETHRNHLEISLDALTILEEITSRLESYGGIALIVDYGHEGTKEDTFRGFRKHQLHDPLVAPGTADLTADVDFSILKQIFSEKGMICGPVTQATFLKRIGIDVRLQSLLQVAKTEDEKKQLQSSYNMIVNDMGSRFHFVGIFPKVLEEFPKLRIAGFHE